MKKMRTFAKGTCFIWPAGFTDIVLVQKYMLFILCKTSLCRIQKKLADFKINCQVYFESLCIKLSEKGTRVGEYPRDKHSLLKLTLV